MKVANKNKNSALNTKPISTKRFAKIEQLISLLPFGFNNKPVVAVLRLDGVIGKVSPMKPGLNLASLNKLIEKTFKLNNLEAVCLCVNSPGGSPVQSELIAKRLRDLANESDIPIYSFVEDVAASGGYWLACAGDKIFASNSSIIGSIGVISSGFGFHKAIDKIGVERRVITEGNNKSILDPFSPLKPSDVKIVKNLQKASYNHFVDNVKERRKGKLTQNDEILFNGEFWTGQKALDYGLIDGIDDLYSFIQKRYGNDVSIEYMENKQSWFRQKFGLSAFTNDLVNSIIENVETRILDDKFNLR